MNIVILFGAPGAGKGTQANLLRQNLGFQHISTGDIFRNEIKKKTELGLLIEESIREGKLLDDKIAIRVILQALQENKDAVGIVLDGFPRTLNQAQFLDADLKERNWHIDHAILLDVNKEILFERLENRSIQENRPDDENIEIMSHRLNEFKRKTQPLADFYEKQNCFHSVKGESDILKVHKEICLILKS